MAVRPSGSNKQPTVFVIDDDPETASSFAALLSCDGFEAEPFFSGATALPQVRDRPPDAVVLDLRLSPADIPGPIVLKGLRKMLPQHPIVAVTGWYGQDSQLDEFRTLGADECLLKPVDASVLAATLHKMLLTRQTSRFDGQAAERGEADAVPQHIELLELAASEDQFVSCQLPGLIRHMQRSFPKTWDDVITEQAEDTLMEFLTTVEAGRWPARGSMGAHLAQATWRNVRDWLQSASRRRSHEARYATERVRAPWRAGEECPVDARRAMPLALDAVEAEALRRWIHGDGDDAIATALGWSQAGAELQAREVKRFKDRIKKRARRLLKGCG